MPTVLGRGSRRLRWIVGATAAAAVLTVTAVAQPFTPQAHADSPHIEVPDGEGQHFVWPVPSWISANDYYQDGREHSGSADFTSPYYTPVHPARPGTVDSVGFNGTSGWNLRLKHETVDGATFYTFYAHLADEPKWKKGQEPGLDDPLGYMSKTGNAKTQHLHFSISRNAGDGREVMAIPGIEIGDWAAGGDYIPGEFDFELDAELPPLDDVSHPRYEVRVEDPGGIGVYETRDRKPEERITRLDAGDVVEINDSQSGQYRIDVDGQDGWIPSSGVAPVAVDNDLSTLETTAGMNVRRGPSESEDVIGRLEADTMLVTLRTNDQGWSYVLWPCTYDTNEITDGDAPDDNMEVGGCPDREEGGKIAMKYGWVGTAYTETTSDFSAITRIADQNVHAAKTVDGESRPDHDQVIGELPEHSTVRVTGVYNGWYQINYDDQTAWIRGWQTSTRR